MRKLEKKIFWVWFAGGLIVALIPGFIGGVLTGFYTSISGFSGFAAGYILSAVLISTYMKFRYRAWGFELRDDHLYIEHGVFRKIKTMVPFVRIQHVDSQRGVIERTVGLSKVIVYTAGSRGADVTVPGLLPQEASDIQEKLRDVAIESEDRDGV
jgi:membrane protein YdbS with pleckstrin-like domain